MAEDFLKCGDLTVTTTTTETNLAIAYLRMLNENVLHIVFHQRTPSLLEFIRDAMTIGNRVTLSAFRGDEFCGLGWVYSSVDLGGFRRAETGMWFSSRQSVKTNNIRFGQMMFDVFFGKYEIDALFGTTPDENKLALRYAQRVGMSLHGPIPDFCTWQGKLTAGWISHIGRENWLARRSALTPQAVA